MGEGADGALHAVASPVQVVREQVAPRRHRGRRPRWWGHRGRLGLSVDERAKRRDPGDAVGDGVVHLHEQPDATVG
jgi:hypothetical protein